MPAPTHRIQIHKYMGAERWSNDYLVAAASMDDAASLHTQFLAAERALHMTIVQFDFALISTVQEADRVFRHIGINLPGLASAGTNQYLPLFNTVRVDMTTGDGDPARKYYRAPIDEGSVDQGKLTAAAVTFYLNALSTPLGAAIATGKYVTSDGRVVTGYTVRGHVQMRQLHRRRKIKVPGTGV